MQEMWLFKLTSGSSDLSSAASRDLLSLMGILLGNTSWEERSLEILRLMKYLRPGIVTIPSTVKSMSGLLRKNICKPPTKGSFGIRGFKTSLKSAESWSEEIRWECGILFSLSYLEVIDTAFCSVQREVYITITVVTAKKVLFDYERETWRDCYLLDIKIYYYFIFCCVFVVHLNPINSGPLTEN